MKMFRWLLAALSLGLCSNAGAWPNDPPSAGSNSNGASRARRAPNVLLILADDLGYSDLGCYGGELYTPNLDALGNNGLRYTSFCTSARCCPSRASLLTGLYPHQTGVGSFTTEKPTPGWGPAYTGHLLPNCVTLAQILGSAGYSTWMVGKWHLGIPGPIELGFQNYYGFKNLLAHSEGQWDPAKYTRLPAKVKPELEYASGKFYVTDVFTDYSLEFLRQARQQPNKPWFLYLAYSSPHFPLHAPKEDIDRLVPTYRKGWDFLRADRFERMKRLGLVPVDTPLPPRSLVPVDRDDIANGYSGQPNPAWDSLAVNRREDLARRMAAYAAMVEHIDRGVGRLVADLKQHGELDNTVVLFMSDNGACYEWGPFGFDGVSREGLNTLHEGPALQNIGQPGTHHSYGSGWAMLCNTPLRLYKHFCQEGGLASPLIVHWPVGIPEGGRWVRDPAALMDILPTICDLTGALYPKSLKGHQITPVEGVSLVPTFSGKPLAARTLAFEHQEARALRRGDWKVVWGKRMPTPPAWELYNLRTDPCEQFDLSGREPVLAGELAGEWLQWAKRVGVHLPQ